MADKLPPVFVVFSSGGHADGIAQLTTNESRSTKYVEMEHACGWDDAHTEKYEPAVPRCKTCPMFKLREQLGSALAYHSDEAFCYRGPGDWTVARADGSGYCGNHPEANS